MNFPLHQVNILWCDYDDTNHTADRNIQLKSSKVTNITVTTHE